jgi:hypothetical protein
MEELSSIRWLAVGREILVDRELPIRPELECDDNGSDRRGSFRKSEHQTGELSGAVKLTDHHEPDVMHQQADLRWLVFHSLVDRSTAKTYHIAESQK